jgi:hypothetical protein
LKIEDILSFLNLIEYQIRSEQIRLIRIESGRIELITIYFLFMVTAIQFYSTLDANHLAPAGHASNNPSHLDTYRVCKPDYCGQQSTTCTTSSLSPSSTLGVGVGAPRPQARDGMHLDLLLCERGGRCGAETLWDSLRGGGGGSSDGEVRVVMSSLFVGLGW